MEQRRSPRLISLSPVRRLLRPGVPPAAATCSAACRTRTTAPCCSCWSCRRSTPCSRRGCCHAAPPGGRRPSSAGAGPPACRRRWDAPPPPSSSGLPTTSPGFPTWPQPTSLAPAAARRCHRDPPPYLLRLLEVWLRHCRVPRPPPVREERCSGHPAAAGSRRRGSRVLRGIGDLLLAYARCHVLFARRRADDMARRLAPSAAGGLCQRGSAGGGAPARDALPRLAMQQQQLPGVQPHSVFMVQSEPGKAFGDRHRQLVRGWA